MGACVPQFRLADAVAGVLERLPVPTRALLFLACLHNKRGVCWGQQHQAMRFDVEREKAKFVGLAYCWSFWWARTLGCWSMCNLSLIFFEKFAYKTP